MKPLSPKFLVFDSNTSAENKEGNLRFCSSKDANVQWPKLRRGRPRKDAEASGFAASNHQREIRKLPRERYEFIGCSDGHPSSPRTRKLVRAHVMHNYGRQKCRKRAMHAEPRPLTLITRENETEKIVKAQDHLSLSTERWSSDPFDSFPIKMEPHMHDLLQLHVSAFADQLYPIEAFWGLNPTKKLWIPLALSDHALLSSILFCSDQFGARMNGQKERPSAITHLRNTIRILNERLQNPKAELSDSTIAAVAGLAMLEQSSGLQSNWSIHMNGIKRMVEMRGGLSSFEYSPMLHDKLCRADLFGSIPTLSKPYLKLDVQKSHLCFVQPKVRPQKHLSTGFQAVLYGNSLGSTLFDILCIIHSVTQELNIINPPKSDVVPMALRRTIRSVQYRILSQDCESNVNPKDIVPKACCLGILLYLGILQNDFCISSISGKVVCQLKSCLEGKSFHNQSLFGLRLWLCFLAGGLVHDQGERQWFICLLSQTISQLSLSYWYEAKLLLESFAWVGKVQDKAAQNLWNEIMQRKSGP